MWCTQWSFQKTVREYQIPMFSPEETHKKAHTKAKFPWLCEEIHNLHETRYKNNLPYNRHCFCRVASSPAEGMQGNRLRDAVQSGLLRHPPYGLFVQGVMPPIRTQEDSQAHNTYKPKCRGCDAEGGPEAGWVTQSSIPWCLPKQRGDEGKGKGESRCQDYLITHGIKSWLLSQSPPPSRSEKGKLSPGEWRFGDLEEHWVPLVSKDSRVATVLLPNRKISSKFSIDLSSNITIF